MKEGFIAIVIALMVSVGLTTMTVFRQRMLGLALMSVGGLLALALIKAAT